MASDAFAPAEEHAVCFSLLDEGGQIVGEGQEVLSEEATRTPKSRGLGSAEDCARSTGAEAGTPAATAATSPPGAAEAGRMIILVQPVPLTLLLRADEVIE